MKTDSDDKYTTYYKNQKFSKVYPTEFVVRSFLGNYPRLTSNKSEYIGKSILDLGFGDGRNMPLLADLGFQVNGVEVTESICQHITEKMSMMGISIGSCKDDFWGSAVHLWFVVCEKNFSREELTSQKI